MSSVGDSCDNAMAEILWSLLKRELNFGTFESKSQARKEVFEWINWYNNDRIHSALNYQSPLQFESLEREKAA